MGRSDRIPFLYWALEPLTALPFKPVALAWIALLVGLLFGGMWTILRTLGWRRPVVPCVSFLATPQTALAVYYANFNVVMFAGIGGALALIGRYPLIAGALLGIEWLKPQVGLPFALLVVVMHRHVWRRVVVGFGAVKARLVPALSLYVMVFGIVLLARNPFPPNALCLPVVAVALFLYVAQTGLVPLQRPAVRESVPPLAVAE